LSVWQIYGTFDLGYLHTAGTKTALYDRYTRWPTNGPAFDFDVNAERPSDGSYAEARGSWISAEDQYYEAVYGKAGAYKAEVFLRDIPNLFHRAHREASTTWMYPPASTVIDSQLTFTFGVTIG
jgi:hypothetical protein